MKAKATKPGLPTIHVPLTTKEEEARAQQYKVLKEAEDKVRYIGARLREYPSIGDQLDMIWKEMKSKYDGGETYSEDAIQMLGSIMAVKAKYPKPE